MSGIHQYPNLKMVNLTVNLGKKYDVTFIRLKFQSPRPASFAIYKKSRDSPSLPDEKPDDGWIPWAYFSNTCEDTYKVQDNPYIVQPRDRSIKAGHGVVLRPAVKSDDKKPNLKIP